MQVSGFYLDMDKKGGSPDNSDSITDAYDDIEGRSPTGTDEQFTLYECHCFLDLDEYPDVDATGEDTGIFWISMNTQMLMQQVKIQV